jgi:hypothetical protein
MRSTVNQATGDRLATNATRGVVESLARELEMPLEHVERVYREEATKIEAEARIKTFVGVIVTRRVRVRLRELQAVTEFDH